MTKADEVMKVLYTLPHEVEPGRPPRWSENAIRAALDAAGVNELGGS